MAETILTDQNFKQEVLDANDLVLVDFYADWCGPCKALEPILDELAKDYEGKPVRITRMNVDQNPQTPAQYQVMSIPNMVLFKSGKAEKQMVGLQDKKVIAEEIDKLLA